MIPYYELPLRQSVMDMTQAVQLDFVEQAKLLLQGFSGVQIEAPARSLILRALAERDLDAALSLLEVAFPALRRAPVEVVYLEGGTLEPHVRLSLRTPPQMSAPIADELKRRLGSIETRSAEGGARVLVSVAPLAKLLGFDNWLSGLTHGAAIAEYRFENYRPRAR